MQGSGQTLFGLQQLGQDLATLVRRELEGLAIVCNYGDRHRRRRHDFTDRRRHRYRGSLGLDLRRKAWLPCTVFTVATGSVAQLVTLATGGAGVSALRLSAGLASTATEER